MIIYKKKKQKGMIISPKNNLPSPIKCIRIVGEQVPVGRP
jgi:hypothetical protein